MSTEARKEYVKVPDPRLLAQLVGSYLRRLKRRVIDQG